MSLAFDLGCYLIKQLKRRQTSDCFFNSSRVTLPFNQDGVSIEKILLHVHVKAKLGLVVIWDEKGSLWVSGLITS